MAPSGSVPRCGGLGLGQHNTIPLPSACMSARSKRLAGPPKKISEAHKVNVAAWSHANGIFVRAQPCVCGRIAACTQVGGLQAARSLSQQGWFFLECVCVSDCVYTAVCVQGPFREKHHSNTGFYLFIIIFFKPAFFPPIASYPFFTCTQAQMSPFKSLVSAFPSQATITDASRSDSISASFKQ